MPTIPLTVRKIDSLKPPASGRVDYWDEALAGFGLRISSSGTRTWMCMFRTKDGRQRRLKLGTYPALPLADARDAAREALRDAQKGKDPAAERDDHRKADTVKALAELYIELHAKAKKRSWRDDQRMLKKDVIPAWGPRKAKTIRRREIIQLLDEIAKRGPIMANRTLETIRSMFSFALEREIVEAHPCVGIKPPGTERPRDRVLTEDEVRAVWQAMGALPLHQGAVLKLRLLTAQRGAEIRAMRWQEIEPSVEKADGIAWWTIPADTAKNGKPHHVPLVGPALDLLRELRKAHDHPTFVFRSKLNTHGATNWAPGDLVRKAAGVSFTPRDLRRTAATMMGGMGIARFTIGRLLNHSDPSVTGRHYDLYAYDREKRAALEAWARRLIEILENRTPADNVVKLAG